MPSSRLPTSFGSGGGRSTDSSPFQRKVPGRYELEFIAEQAALALGMLVVLLPANDYYAAGVDGARRPTSGQPSPWTDGTPLRTPQQG
jgi:hypothetical protein